MLRIEGCSGQLGAISQKRANVVYGPGSRHVTPPRRDMPNHPACMVCGHAVFDAKNHDIPAPRAAKMFPPVTCKCGKPARVRCFNGIGTFWTECEDGHGRGRPA
jgi:hypothetical protein